MRYILNLGTRKLHDSHNADGRCKLNKIKSTNRISFDNITDAINYLPKGKQTIDFCGICMAEHNK